MFNIEYYNRYNQRIVVADQSTGIPITGAISDIVTANLPANLVLISSASGKIVTSAGLASKIANINDTTGPIQAAIDSKEPILTKGNLSEVTSSVLTVSGGTAAVIGSGVTIQVKQATGGQSGYLSSGDWNTFNSKMSNSLANGAIWIGDGGGLAQPRVPSGDATISNLGVVSISAGAIVNSDVNASAAIAVSKLAAMTASKVAVTDVSGFLNTSTITPTELGFLSGITGATIQTQLGTKLTVSLSSVAQGDIIYYNGSSWVNFPKGSNGQILSSTASSIQWINSSSNVPAGGTVNQYLKKNSGTDYDTAWGTIEVGHLNGVTASAAQINVLSTGYYDATSSVQTQLISKLSTSLAYNNLLVGDASGFAVALPPGTNGYFLSSVGGVPTWTATILSPSNVWLAASGVTLTGNNTITMGAYTVTFTGNKVSFTPNATTAGLNTGSHTADPSSPANADIYYNSTANELRARINGSWVALGAGGGGGDMLLGTAQTVTAAKIFNVGTLKLDDSDSAFNLILGSTSTITTADKTLTFDVNDADRTLTIAASATLNGGTHSGTNTGDQTSIVGITGTKAEFDTAVTDGNFLYVGDAVPTGAAWLLASGGTLTGANTIAMAGFDVTFTGIGTVTFSPTSTQPGLNVGSYAGIPGTLDNGDVWYNSTANHFIGRQSGSSKPFMQFNSATITGNRIPYAGNSTGFTESADLTFDGTGLLVGGGTITASTRMDIRGTGTTTNTLSRLADSANTARVTILDEGKHTYDSVSTVTSGDANYSWSIGGTQAFRIVTTTGQLRIGQSNEMQIGRANNSLVYAFGSTNEVFLFTNNEDVDQYGLYFQMGAQTHTTGSTREYFTLDGNTLTSASGAVAAKHLTLKSTFNVQGTGQLTYVSAEPTFTGSPGWGGPVTGFDWNPGSPANIAGTHIAYRATSGKIAFGSSVVTNTHLAFSNQSNSTNIVEFRNNSDNVRYTLTNSGVSTQSIIGGSTITLSSSVSQLTFVSQAISGASSHIFSTFSLPLTDSAASGLTIRNIFVDGEFNTTGSYTGTYISIDVNHSITNNVGLTHLAWRNTSGSVLIGGSTITSGDVLVDLQSTSKAIVITRFAGDVASPVDGMIHYNSTTPAFRFRQNGTWVSLGGGGISNSAANNEMMKSDGTNAVPSGIFSTTAGDIILGTGLAGSQRSISAAGSATDVTLSLSSKGINPVVVSDGNITALLSLGSSALQLTSVGTHTNTVLNVLQITGQTSNTPATGIGTGIQIITETSASNYETGTILESVTTNVGSGTEAFDLVLRLMDAGATATEKWRMSSLGVQTIAQAVSAPGGNPTAAAYLWADPTTQLPKWKVPGGTTYTLSDTGGGGGLTFQQALAISTLRL